jgi:protein-L-isoaspartate O-methyltransferase
LPENLYTLGSNPKEYDLVRTEKLIQGIATQVKVLKQKTVKPLYIVEAGGGTGILSIAAAFAGADQVTVLEINSETAARTKAVIESLGLSDRVSIVFANARNYIPEKKIDMIICECLHTGLAFEPQLQIIHHLGKFLEPYGKLIPEGVTLRWAVAHADWTGVPEMHTEYRYLQKNIIMQGQWSHDQYVDFRETIEKPDVEKIHVVIPAHTALVNTILVEMDVTITTSNSQSLVLHSGEADFLGHPHAIRLKEEKSIADAPYVVSSVQPGEQFSHEVIPIFDEGF